MACHARSSQVPVPRLESRVRHYTTYFIRVLLLCPRSKQFELYLVAKVISLGFSQYQIYVRTILGSNAIAISVDTYPTRS